MSSRPAAPTAVGRGHPPIRWRPCIRTAMPRGPSPSDPSPRTRPARRCSRWGAASSRRPSGPGPSRPGAASTSAGSTRRGSAWVRRSCSPATSPGCGKTFAYLPEGPALPWDAVAADPAAWLDPLVAWAKSAGSFALRLGFPVRSRTWTPEPVKEAGGRGRSALLHLPHAGDRQRLGAVARGPTSTEATGCRSVPGPGRPSGSRATSASSTSRTVRRPRCSRG